MFNLLIRHTFSDEMLQGSLYLWFPSMYQNYNIPPHFQHISLTASDTHKTSSTERPPKVCQLFLYYLAQGFVGCARHLE